MAVRMTPSGPQSYQPTDPFAKFKKKKPTDTGGGGIPSAPITPPKPEPDASTLAGRLAAFGVSPRQPGMSSELSAELQGVLAQTNLTPQQKLATSMQREIAAIQPQAEVPTIQTQGAAPTPRAYGEGGISAKDILFGQPTIEGKPVQMGVAPIIGVGAGAAAVSSIFSRSAASTGASKLLSGNLAKAVLTGYISKIFIGRQLSTADSIRAENIKIMGDVKDAVKNGQLSYADAIQIYTEKQQEISTMERQISWITKNSIISYLSGGKDTLIKFKNAQEITIPELRKELIEADLEFRTSQVKARFGVA